MAKARTARQKAALRKAQLASARKRRGKGRGRSVARKRGGSKLKTAAKVVGVATAIGAVAYTSHKLNGKRKRHSAKKSVDRTVGLQTKARYKNPHVSHRAVRRITAHAIHSAGSSTASEIKGKKRKGAPKSRSFRANMAGYEFNMMLLRGNIQKFRR